MQYLLGAIFGVIFFVGGAFCMWRVYAHYEADRVAAKVKVATVQLDSVSPKIYRKNPAPLVDYDDEEDDD